MIDIPSGRVAYAVLSFGGFLGMGNKLFAVPLSALTVDEDEKCFILDVDQKTLESAPGFDKDYWPDMADTGWGAEVFRHYGATPYWETKESMTLSGRVFVAMPERKGQFRRRRQVIRTRRIEHVRGSTGHVRPNGDRHWTIQRDGRG
jgi:surface antigen